MDIGTPVSNSMVELYVMQRYLRPDLLRKAGVENFDDWASTFGEVVSQLEMKPAGDGYRMKNRFSKFVNIPELMQMYKEFADIQTADMLKLDVPELKTGKPIIVSAKPDDRQKAYMKELAVRSEAIHNGNIDPSQDNMLKITHEARLLGLDSRCIFPSVEITPDSKVSKLLDNLEQNYYDTAEQKGVQIVFCDIAINEDSEHFSVYEAIKADLVKRGISGHKLTVNGSVIQSGGTVSVNGGQLEVTGDYRIQTAVKAANGAVTYKEGSGVLKMTNEADYVKVAGSFVTQSITGHNNMLTAGTLEVKGDFTQSSVSNNSIYCFLSKGTHKVLLSGDKKQTVTFDSSYGSSYSLLNNLEIKNTSAEGIDFAKNVYVKGTLKNESTPVISGKNIYVTSTTIIADNHWGYDLSIYDGYKLLNDTVIDGNLYIRAYPYGVDLNNHTLTVNGNVTVDQGTIQINKGKFIISGDFSIWGAYTRLSMTNDTDYMLVEGNFNDQSSNSHNGSLTAGTLEVQGNFTQGNGSQSFYATGTHKVILSGTGLQTVSFESTKSKFNILEITKPIDLGYTFNRKPVWSELIEAAIDQEAPTAPQNLTCTLIRMSAITLEWNKSTDNRRVTGYDIYRNGVKVGTTSETEYIDTGLIPDTTYTYYIIAHDIVNNQSEKSGELQVTTKTDPNIPTAPTDLVVAKNNSLIKLSWAASTDNVKVAGYKIYRNEQLIGTSDGTSCTDTLLEQGKYVYYVRAFDDVGNLSKESNSVTVNNLPLCVPVLKLDLANLNSVSISWSCTDSTRIVGYNVYRNGNKISDVTDTKYADIGLTPNTEYTYYVEAYDNDGNLSQISNKIKVSTEIDNILPVVKLITPISNVFSKKIPLNITVSDNISVKSVLIQYSYDNSTWKDAGSSESKLISTNEIINYNMDLSEITEGYIYVRAIAYDSSNNASSTSSCPVVRYYVDNTKPNSPQNLKVEYSEGKMDVRWSAPKESDVAYFKIYRSVNNSASFILVNSRCPYINYIDTSFEIGKEYFYKVIAVDDAGNESDYSEIVSGKIESDTFKPEVLSINPKSNDTLRTNQVISILCSDNFRLKNVTVEGKEENSDEWDTLDSNNTSDHSKIIKVNFTKKFDSDCRYMLKVTLSDSVGNTNVYTYTYNYKACSLSKPQLTAAPGGWKVELKWTMTNTEDLAGYNVYQKSSSENNYHHIAGITNQTYTVEKLDPDLTYSFIIEAVDKYGSKVKSDTVEVTPTNEDEYPPEAYAGIDMFAIEGMDVNFDGTGSFDNNIINSYNRDFGDGTTSNSSKPSHTYGKEGEYTVTLTVKDKSGNSASDTVKVKIYNKEHAITNIKVVDNNNMFVNNAMVYFKSDDGSEFTVKTNSSGIAEIICKQGDYEFYIYKEGYLPVSKKVTIGDNSQTVTAVIEKSELITGKIEVERLNLTQIIGMGIDINAPENQYVYEYKLKINYKEDENSAWTFLYVNSAGEFINTETTWSQTCDGIKRIYWLNAIVDPDDPSLPPTIAILEITTSISWLKEFYQVNLMVTNNATNEFTVENSYATLKLPNGLSLADTSFKQNLVYNMGTVQGQQTKTASWVIRGDKAGKYNIEAMFNGTLMPFNTPISSKFVTDNPIEVHGGNVFNLEVNNDIWGIKSDAFHTYFKLTNISDIPVYGTNIKAYLYGFKEFTGAERMIIHYPDGSTEVIWFVDGQPISDANANTKKYLPVFASDISDGRMVLKPNQYIWGEIVFFRPKAD